MKDFTSRELRNALGCFATGVAIVTTTHEGKPTGMTINSFASVSLDPPLVLWSLAESAALYDVFLNAESYNIHILAENQQDLSNQFATPDIDNYQGLSWKEDDRGIPFLPGCLARFHCEKDALHEGGDHKIIVGRVIEIAREVEDKPLLFAQGKYSNLKD